MRFRQVAFLLVALLVVCSGTAIGASKIKGSQIARSAVSSKHIKNGGVAEGDLSGGVRSKLNQAGQQGPPGPAGTVGAVTKVMGPMNYVPPGEVGSSRADCPPGTAVVGGGWDGGDDPPVSATQGYNTSYGNSWGVIWVNQASIGSTLAAVALCAQGATPPATLHAESFADIRRGFAQQIARAR